MYSNDIRCERISQYREEVILGMENKVLVIGQLPPPIHGSNIMTEMIVGALKNIGSQVLLVQKKFSASHQEIGQLRLKKLFAIPNLILGVLMTAAFRRPDICILFNAVRAPAMYIDLVLVALLKIARIKTVLYVHGKGLTSNIKNYGLINKFIVRKILTLASGAFVLGDKMKADVDLYIPDEKLFVLPNAIAKIDDKNIISTTKNKRKVLFLSNLVPEKGPFIFLETAKLVHEEFDNVEFVLAGEARTQEYQKKLNGYIETNGLSKVITLPGKVVGEQKKHLFESCDVFVFPTYYDKEVAPLVILEAMQYGMPVVASNEGCISELIDDAINGYVVKDNNCTEIYKKLALILSDDEKLLSMSIESKNRFQKLFSEEIYEKNLARALNFASEL